MGVWVVAVALFLAPVGVHSGDCVDMNYCNGHGTCQTQTDSCDCAFPPPPLHSPPFVRGRGRPRP